MVTKSRSLAHQLLMSVETDGVYPNILLPKMLASSGLDKKDRGFLQELAYGCMRMQIQYDAIIGAMTDTKKLDTDVLIALRLALHELVNMRTGDHAAVDQYVELTKTFKPKASGLVNALLRRFTREKEQLVAEATRDGADLEALYGHPRWIIDALAASRELDGASNVVSLLEINNKSPRPQMVALPPTSIPEGADALPLSEIGFEPKEEEVSENYRYQDQGSQLVTQIATKASQNGRWLDMCAGPGGKASLLASIAKQRDSTLTAIELYPHRAKLVSDSLKGFDNTTVHTADATSFGYQDKYELVLIDAPCTGLGALRRKPESRHNKQPAQLQELNKTQRALLDTASSLVVPNGIVAYITCSPVIEETTAVARWFLDAHDDFVLLPWHDYSDAGANKNRKTLQLWSDIHNSDCMFLALFQKQ